MTDELPFEIHYSGPPIKDDIPDEIEIHNALFKRRNRKAPGLSKITVKLLKQ